MEARESQRLSREAAPSHCEKRRDRRRFALRRSAGREVSGHSAGLRLPRPLVRVGGRLPRPCLPDSRAAARLPAARHQRPRREALQRPAAPPQAGRAIVPGKGPRELVEGAGHRASRRTRGPAPPAPGADALSLALRCGSGPDRARPLPDLHGQAARAPELPPGRGKAVDALEEPPGPLVSAGPEHRRRARERAVLVCALLALLLGLCCWEGVATALGADPTCFEQRERQLAFRLLSLTGLSLGVLGLALRRVIAAQLVPLLAAGLTLACVLALFLATDLFLGYRLMSPKRHGEEAPDIHQPDDRLGWVLRSGARGRHRIDGNFDVEYRIDAEGFREIPPPSSPRRTLWVFGDPFTFGFGVENEEAWPALLARRLLEQRIRVVNTAVGGYGVIQMYGRLQDLADALGPDDIVLFAPISEDLQRSLKDFTFVARLLFGHETRDWRFPSFEGGEIRGVPIDGTWNRVRGLFLHGPISEAVFRFVNRAITGPAALAEGHAVVDAARALCADRDVDFLLVFLPKVLELRSGRYEVDVSSFEYADVRRFFPADRAALDELRFPTDPHWNPRGHRVAADAVFGALAGSGLL